MLHLLLRRLRNLLVVLLVVGSMMFFILRLIPGDAASSLLGGDAKPEQVQALRAALGLDQPPLMQYLHWLSRVAVADLGESVSLHEPVARLIARHLVPTLCLAVAAMVLAFVLAVAITTWNAIRPRNRLARLLAAGAAVGVAIPEFWIALVLVAFFGVRLDWLPTSGWVDPLADPLGALPFLALPLASIVVGLTATYVLVLRESVLRELTRLYLRTARVKGLGETRIILLHVLKNAMLPCVTVMGTRFAHMVGGVVIIEAIFVIPGLGSLLLGAINSRDYVLVQGLTVFLALLFIVVNLLVDLSYMLLDPKVRAS